MKMKKVLAFFLAATITAGCFSVPNVTSAANAAAAAQVQGGQETVTTGNYTFYRASADYKEGDTSYEGMPLFNEVGS